MSVYFIDAAYIDKQDKTHISFAYNAKMNLDTLALFIDVMQHLSFTEVATKRNVAPSLLFHVPFQN